MDPAPSASTVVHDYPLPPTDLVMPATVQEVALWMAAAALAGFMIYAIRQALQQRSALPVLYLVAGFCTVLLEPLVTHMGHAIHPEIGQIVLFKVADRAIPLHIALIYSFYFGGVYMVLLPRIFRNEMTRAAVWKSYLAVCVLAYLIELAPVQFGLWVYYDTQALWIWKGGMPLFWTFVNAGCIFFPMALMKLMQPLTGLKQILVVPLSLIGAAMGHFGAGVPFYNATNSNAGPFLVELSGLASVALALLLVHVSAGILAGARASSPVDHAATESRGSPTGEARA